MDLTPKKKPYTVENFKKRADIFLQGTYGSSNKTYFIDLIQQEVAKGIDAGVITMDDAVKFLKERKNKYDEDILLQQETSDQPAIMPDSYQTEVEGRKNFGEGSGDRTDLDYVNLTRIENAKATGSSISNASKFKALPGYDNITYTDYKDKNTGDVNRKYNVRLRVVEDGKTKVLTKGPQFQNINSLDDAVKIRNDLRKTNPKNIPVRDPGADAADKARRVEAIRKNEGLPYSYSGTKSFPKGHAGNIYGKNKIIPSEIIYTPQNINAAMSGKKGLGFDRSNPVQALDFKIKDTEEKIKNIKKSNMSAAKKKTELAKLDNKLINYVARSDGYKIATLSDDSKYGKSFQSLKSLDMFDEFEGMSEKEMNNFIKKYKNMKVKKDTPQAVKDNIIKAKIAAENIKFAKQNAARGGGGTQMFDAFKPSGLSPFRKLKMLSNGGPVKYGKYAEQIAKLSS